VLERVLCPSLVGRDQELFVLEDALLAARGGDGRFVALGGDAGMGKTRLATEVAKRARRLDCAVLWGGCSEAELSLPYLPIVEAIGNYLAVEDVERLGSMLGAARAELTQLFPQFGQSSEHAAGGEPGQAKLRLFEAIVALLAIPARERGLLLVIEDAHWADAATRQLLDHLARRLTSLRSLALLTYRSDELDRRHPLAPLLQTWRRAGLAEVVTLSRLDAAQIGEMIGAILDERDVAAEFSDLMHLRTEGNPFVLEEMLKEAIDRGDVFRAGEHWDRRAGGELRIPETVRDTILMRFARLEPEHAEILQAAAVLGRTFDYATLVRIVEPTEAAVQAALALADAQQLIEDTREGGTYRWRHALTQEAIADEIVRPRRQQIDSRAADAFAASHGRSVDVARHLLEAGRFDEAVAACVVAADEAEASLAFAEALELLDRALPHVHDRKLRGRVLCRMGRALWVEGRTPAAEEVLREGVSELDVVGEEAEAARYRLDLGRCCWEQSKPAEALDEFERARAVLETQGPSAALAMAYMRIAGQYKFDRDNERSLEAVMKAVEIAEAAGAEFERVWAKSWAAFILLDTGRTDDAWRMLDDAFDEALRRGFTFVARNIAYNDSWTRLHTMTAGVGDRLSVFDEAGPPVMIDMTAIAGSWTRRIEGDLEGALEVLRRGERAGVETLSEKVRWRTRVELAEVLLELGRLEEAAAALPDPSERAELQDTIYDALPQIRLRLADGRLDEAVGLARDIAANAGRLVSHETLAVAVEALVAADLLDEAQAVVDVGRTYPTDAGGPYLDEAQARIFLARGRSADAAELSTGVARVAADRGFTLVEWRLRVLAAEAAALSGARDEAERELGDVAAAAAAANALLIRDLARSAAARAGLAVPEGAEGPAGDGVSEELVDIGERLVTSFFADVRGYSGIAAASAPADVADRLGALHRWASAEVSRHHGFVDKFAGDAVMATFNATGARLDHTAHALEAALALSGKAALLDLGLGIGIAVGPAIVGRAVAGANVSVLGETTNLAARLQTVAAAGEIVLSEEAHRRVADWLEKRGLEAALETVELKGFDGAQRAWRLATGVQR
jgi:class 3 adenylate cyclase/tetratricopeptide (TPR) repeat protein